MQHQKNPIESLFVLYKRNCAINITEPFRDFLYFYHTFYTTTAIVTSFQTYLGLHTIMLLLLILLLIKCYIKCTSRSSAVFLLVYQVNSRCLTKVSHIVVASCSG